MSIIVALSLISFAIAFTMLVAGYNCSQDLMSAGIFLLVALFILHFGFQLGAEWQRDDTMVRFSIEPKEESK